MNHQIAIDTDIRGIIESEIAKITAPRLYPVAIAVTVTFFMLVTSLAASGLIPELSKTSLKVNVLAETVPVPVTAPETGVVLPDRISIKALGINSVILNPAHSDLETLDHALLQGVVRYPGSATLGLKGNMILFGHSSHLALVHNKAYQSLNDINTLKINDELSVYSSNREYRYKVTKVWQAKSTDSIATSKPGVSALTLVTCNNFGSKEDRYVVEAQLIN